MKFILEKCDENLINNINKDINAGVDLDTLPVYLSRTDKRYYIEFKCNDIAKANNFICLLMNPNPEIQQYVKDSLGIDVLGLNFRGIGDISELKEDVLKLLNKLERM